MTSFILQMSRSSLQDEHSFSAFLNLLKLSSQGGKYGGGLSENLSAHPVRRKGKPLRTLELLQKLQNDRLVFFGERVERNFNSCLHGFAVGLEIREELLMVGEKSYLRTFTFTVMLISCPVIMLGFIQNLGAMEIFLILLIVLLLFGAKRLPELSRSMGRSLREFKKATSEVEDDFKKALNEEPEKKQGGEQVDRSDDSSVGQPENAQPTDSKKDG